MNRRWDKEEGETIEVIVQFFFLIQRLLNMRNFLSLICGEYVKTQKRQKKHLKVINTHLRKVQI